MAHSTPSKTVVVLKWLCWPRTTWPTIITISITPVSTISGRAGCRAACGG